MWETIKAILLSEFILGAFITMAAWALVTFLDKTKFFKKSLPFVVEIFKFVEDQAGKYGFTGEQKWVLFLRVFVETYEKEHGTIDVNELSYLKGFINDLAAKQEKKLPKLLEKHSDPQIRAQILALEKNILS